MSSNLFCLRYAPEDGKDLSKKLKYILAPRYWEHDGSLGGKKKLLTEGDLGFLEGIATATDDKEVQKDVKKLIKLIEKDSAVWIYIE